MNSTLFALQDQKLGRLVPKTTACNRYANAMRLEDKPQHVYLF